MMIAKVKMFVEREKNISMFLKFPFVICNLLGNKVLSGGLDWDAHKNRMLVIAILKLCIV